MGIFSRISEIINSNVNSMLDKAEDPEKMVRLMISEMEDTLIEVKSSAAEIIADKMRIKRNIEQLNGKTAEWESKAELAIEKGREDLARAAIEQKLQYQSEVGQLETRLSEIDAISKQYQDDIKRLEEKLESAKSRQKIIIANHQSALNRKKVEEQIHRVNHNSAFARFDNYQHRIDRYQAEAEVLHQSNSNFAANDLDRQFQDLEQGSSIDEELKKLKEKTAKATTKKPKEEAAVSG